MTAGEDPDLHRRAKQIFLELMETPEETWTQRVAEVCDGDEALEREVISLLRSRGADTSDLEPRVDAGSSGLPAGVTRAVLDELARVLNSQADSGPLPSEGDPASTEPWLAGRYSLEERVGLGGMGEVWRAKDHMLAETVALKFIRSRGSAWVARLLRETAIARRISHRNVCRVHDVAHVDGIVFLSMEYVEGHDLAGKLRREGRLGAAESRRIAVELVDALVAIHEKGLLHRDLKPANVLLDEDGSARITDFGIATFAETADEDTSSGTRAYMAPEQLRGEPPSEASDIYSLGLVLYESVTDQHASPDEVRGAAESGAVAQRPSALVPGLDPVLDHIIMRCLDPVADARPTAAELRAALRKDDPLSAVLALGDAPSAEVIQGSTSRLPLSSTHARRLLLVAFAALALTTVIKHLRGVHLLPERSPEEAAQQCRSVVSELLGSAPVVTAFELFRYGNEIPSHARSGFRLADRPGIEPTERHFWYRTSGAPLWPREARSQLFGFGRVRAFDPAPGSPGTTTVVLDRSGDLVFLDVRTQPEGSVGETPPASWERVFQLAGLRPADFERCDPLPARAAQADRRIAWENGDASLRLEVATRADRVVALELLEPERGRAVTTGSYLFVLLNVLLVALLLALALPRAIRHFRSGRGDLQVSLRVALAVATALLGSWTMYADYPGRALDGFFFVAVGVVACAAGGFLVWTLSVATEPNVQRDWPRTFITWSQLFHGRLDRAGVRSDLLTGLVVGLVVVLLQTLLGAAMKDGADFSPVSRAFEWGVWSGTAFEAFAASVVICLELVVLLAVLRWLLRGRRPALLGTWALACSLAAGSSEGTGPALMAALSLSLMLIGLVRYGLLATFALALCTRLFENTPLAPRGEVWYAPYGYATVGLVTVLLIWAARPLVLSSYQQPRG